MGVWIGLDWIGLDCLFGQWIRCVLVYRIAIAVIKVFIDGVYIMYRHVISLFCSFFFLIKLGLNEEGGKVWSRVLAAK
jgi:hypothetical protein